MPSNIKYFRDVLSKEQQDYVAKKVFTGGWRFQGVSKEGSQKFWHMDLRNDPFFSIEFFQRVREVTQTNFKMLRVYANGHTYGLPGSFHRDDLSDESFTFVYYANPKWDMQWGGATVFATGEQVMPFPNCAILFKGNVLHYGGEPSRFFTGLRVTVAFKLHLTN